MDNHEQATASGAIGPKEATPGITAQALLATPSSFPVVTRLLGASLNLHKLKNGVNVSRDTRGETSPGHDEDHGEVQDQQHRRRLEYMRAVPPILQAVAAVLIAAGGLLTLLLN